jgi:hypothetical protein
MKVPIEPWIVDVLRRPATNVPTTAKILRKGRNQTYKAVHDGEIPSTRIGNSIIIPTAWIREVLQITADDLAGDEAEKEAA